MKGFRKGFTLVELLIVIAILGALSAAMSVSSSKATTAAKVTTIYNNINTIKTAALLYQLQEGASFKEENVTAKALSDAELINLDDYNKDKSGTKDNPVRYAIVAGDNSNGTGAYVICTFYDETDYDDIAKSLSAYKNIRVDEDKCTVGAFLYHNTPATKGNAAYDVVFAYPSTTTTTNP